MKNILAILLVFSVLLLVCGCETVRVGGRGKVGTIRGSGDVVIDVPEKDK